MSNSVDWWVIIWLNGVITSNLTRGHILFCMFVFVVVIGPLNIYTTLSHWVYHLSVFKQIRASGWTPLTRSAWICNMTQCTTPWVYDSWWFTSWWLMAIQARSRFPTKVANIVLHINSTRLIILDTLSCQSRQSSLSDEITETPQFTKHARPPRLGMSWRAAGDKDLSSHISREESLYTTQSD